MDEPKSQVFSKPVPVPFRAIRRLWFQDWEGEMARARLDFEASPRPDHPYRDMVTVSEWFDLQKEADLRARYGSTQSR